MNETLTLMNSLTKQWINARSSGVPTYLVVGGVGFVLGIVAYEHIRSEAVGLFALLLAFVFTFLFWRQKERSFLFIALLALVAAFGVARTAIAPAELPSAFMPLTENAATVEGRVVESPDVRESTQRLTLRVAEGEAHTRVLVISGTYPSVRYGERIRASGTLEKPEPFTTDGGRTFAYDDFLRKDGVFLIMRNASIEVVGEREHLLTHLQGALSDFKSYGISSLAAALPEPHASLASGLILGGKQGLGEKLLDEFVVVGLVHIVVLSGYNVMLVAEFVMRLCGFLGRRLAAVVGASAIILFVLAAGAGAASMRAGIMATVAVYARASGKTYDAVRALIVAALLMLIANPLLVLHDPGFQLSFVATLGLILGAPVVERYLTGIPNTFMREILASTIAAQVSVLPLLLYQNGLFSLIALPANVLVLPFVPLAMLMSLFAGVAGALVPTIAPVVGLPAYALLSYIVAVAEAGAQIPFAAISLPAFPFLFVIGAYATLFVLFIVLTRRHSLKTSSERTDNPAQPPRTCAQAVRALP